MQAIDVILWSLPRRTARWQGELTEKTKLDKASNEPLCALWLNGFRFPFRACLPLSADRQDQAGKT